MYAYEGKKKLEKSWKLFGISIKIEWKNFWENNFEKLSVNIEEQKGDETILFATFDCTFVEEIRAIVTLFARRSNGVIFHARAQPENRNWTKRGVEEGWKEDSLDTSDVKASTSIREKVILITELGHTCILLPRSCLHSTKEQASPERESFPILS